MCLADGFLLAYLMEGSDPPTTTRDINDKVKPGCRNSNAHGALDGVPGWTRGFAVTLAVWVSNLSVLMEKPLKTSFPLDMDPGILVWEIPFALRLISPLMGIIISPQSHSIVPVSDSST